MALSGLSQFMVTDAWLVSTTDLTFRTFPGTRAVGSNSGLMLVILSTGGGREGGREAGREGGRQGGREG